MEKMKAKGPTYWIKFRAMQAKAAKSGLYCPSCKERRYLGKDVTADVTADAFRCKACKKACEFNKGKE